MYDCIHFCSFSNLEWSDEAIQQDYIAPLNSNCHFSTPVIAYDNDVFASPNDTTPFIDETIESTPYTVYEPIETTPQLIQDDAEHETLKSEPKPDVVTVVLIVGVCFSITMSIMCGLKKRKTLKKFAERISRSEPGKV